MDRYELRRLDYSLTEDHLDLQAAYAKFFGTHCTIDVVRSAEQVGFDKSLWERLCATGATSMGLWESAGGDGATLVDLCLVAEEVGRVLAPVPWIDHVCATRLLARLGVLDDHSRYASDALSGKRIVVLDPSECDGDGVRLVPAGAIADDIVVCVGDEIVRLSFDSRPERVDNIGRLPMAWVDTASADRRSVLARGEQAVAHYRSAVDEWRLLTASALVGLVDRTMRIAVDFAKSRYTLGVPISSLQAISHPLANIAIVVESGRNLVRRAAWFLENEPDSRPELAAAAFVYMAGEASTAATIAVNTQGGLGVSEEAAGTAYLVRSRGWPLAGGDPSRSALRIAELVAQRERRSSLERARG